MEYFLVYITPIIAIIFFVNCVSLAKKIHNGDGNTAINTGCGAIMFGYLIFILITAGLLN